MTKPHFLIYHYLVRNYLRNQKIFGNQFLTIYGENDVWDYEEVQNFGGGIEGI